jgi:outer membrane protein
MVQAAQLGQARAAYLPTINLTAQAVHQTTVTWLNNMPYYDTDQKQRFQSQSANLSWVLYDFGARAAALTQAHQLLAAAKASQDAELQSAVANTAKDYYAALAAKASVDAAQDAENIAQQSLNTATERMTNGVAPISEQLRAQTAYEQAKFNRNKAQGDADIKLGTLAIDMGIAPDLAPELPSMPSGELPDTGFVKPVSDLLKQAEIIHPELIAAREQLAAAQANVDVVRDQGRPTITLQSSLSRNTQPESLGIGEALVNATQHQNSIGIQVNVPLFEGFTRRYKINNAEAQVEQQRGELMDAEQQVELNVWSGARNLKTASANLIFTQNVLDSARAALRSARRRYQAGVADIQEILDVQKSLADAEQQYIQGVADWYTARIQLANAIGTLGTWAVQ